MYPSRIIQSPTWLFLHIPRQCKISRRSSHRSIGPPKYPPVSGILQLFVQHWPNRQRAAPPADAAIPHAGFVPRVRQGVYLVAHALGRRYSSSAAKWPSPLMPGGRSPRLQGITRTCLCHRYQYPAILTQTDGGSPGNSQFRHAGRRTSLDRYELSRIFYCL